jgi:hypothetical protein
MNYYSAMKKNQIMSAARKGKEIEIIMLSEIRKTKMDKYHIFSVI